MGLDMYLFAQRKLPEGTTLTAEEQSEFDREKEAYISGYEFYPHESRNRYRSFLRAAGLQSVADPDTPSAHIISDGAGGFALQACVAYWRKANQIHAWFVDECQGGVDECQLSDPIPREKLLELRNLCARILGKTELEEGTVNMGYLITPEAGWEPIQEKGLVIANPALAQEYLPPREGFFFGSTDYDHGYVHDLIDTVQQIDRAIRAPEDVVFLYHSSW